MRLRHKAGVVLGVALFAATATATSASASTSEHYAGGMQKVTCGSRTDWVRLWTQYHGYPVCFANNGVMITDWSPNPPKTTWTSYGICFGNNSGNVVYYALGSDGRYHEYTEYFPSGHCDNWSADFGVPVEVYEVQITGR